jgi:hypothetical protein
MPIFLGQFEVAVVAQVLPYSCPPLTQGYWNAKHFLRGLLLIVMKFVKIVDLFSFMEFLLGLCIEYFGENKLYIAERPWFGL